MKHSRTLAFFLIIAVCSAGTAFAGRVSLAVKGAKMALKAGAKETAKEASKKMLREEAERLARRYGRKAVASVDAFAQKSGVSRKAALRILADHGDVLARHGFSQEALTFAHKHGGAGVFFLRHPPLFEGLKKSTDITRVDHSVIVQAWRWGDEKAIGGSMERLRKTLTDAGMNTGLTRDFCEDLFIVKARTGKIPGISKGSELIKGHIGDGRQGVDMFLPENGKVRAIEFGTGSKPIAGEMSWERIRSNLADFLELQSGNGRINLRGKGFPSELVAAPGRVRSPEFPIEKYVQRELYATSINKNELAKAGPDIIAYELK